MTTPLLAGHPFGTTVTEETLRNTFLPLNQWEDKYRQLILLGKQLPALPDALKAQAKEIAGCENRVWLGYTLQDNGTLHFLATAKDVSCAVCWRFYSPPSRAKPPPSYRRIRQWRSLMNWVYAHSLAPRAAEGLNALIGAVQDAGWQR